MEEKKPYHKILSEISESMANLGKFSKVLRIDVEKIVPKIGSITSKDLERETKDLETSAKEVVSEEAIILKQKIDFLSSEIDKRFEDLEDNMKNVRREIDQLSDIKTQIFSVLAMVFGVIAIIQIDIGITKGFFSDLFAQIESLRTAWVTLVVIFIFFLVQVAIISYIHHLVCRCFDHNKKKK